MNGIGIVFNIDDLGGGFYGSKAWRIFMRNLPPENIIGCMLKEGDTQQTLNGSQREFCIAVFGLALEDAVVRKVFENCSEKGLAPAARRFISSPGSELLVDAGFIDLLGRLVQDEWSRMFHDRCKDCGWGFAPKSVTVDLTPELKAELENLRGKTVPLAAQEAAKKRAEELERKQKEAERKRREEEEKRRAEEQKRRQAEEARRKAEDERRARVQAARKSSGQCMMCGQSLGFVLRLLGKDRHGRCTSFKE